MPEQKENAVREKGKAKFYIYAEGRKGLLRYQKSSGSKPFYFGEFKDMHGETSSATLYQTRRK